MLCVTNAADPSGTMPRVLFPEIVPHAAFLSFSPGRGLEACFLSTMIVQGQGVAMHCHACMPAPGPTAASAV